MERFLMMCMEKQVPVEMIYIADNGNISQRTILIRDIYGTTIKAYCQLRRRTRTFKLENILGVNYRKTTKDRNESA